jgi:muramoyltetrapeptide carboxypeptidase LdcA involved in peptidoglycan recycling
MLESWGLEVDFGEHVFGKVAWVAGTDEERPTEIGHVNARHMTC